MAVKIFWIKVKHLLNYILSLSCAIVWRIFWSKYNFNISPVIIWHLFLNPLKIKKASGGSIVKVLKGLRSKIFFVNRSQVEGSWKAFFSEICPIADKSNFIPSGNTYSIFLHEIPYLWPSQWNIFHFWPFHFLIFKFHLVALLSRETIVKSVHLCWRSLSKWWWYVHWNVWFKTVCF